MEDLLNIGFDTGEGKDIECLTVARKDTEGILVLNQLYGKEAIDLYNRLTKAKRDTVIEMFQQYNYKEHYSKKDEYELFKVRHLQQPITLLTEENLERLERYCINNRKNDIGRRFREHEIVLELIDEYKRVRKEKEKDKLC